MKIMQIHGESGTKNGIAARQPSFLACIVRRGAVDAERSLKKYKPANARVVFFSLYFFNASKCVPQSSTGRKRKLKWSLL